MRTSILRFVVFTILCFGVFLVWAAWPFGVGAETLADSNLTQRGQYGDSFGALNTLFTGFAFAGVAFTVYLQITSDRGRERERRKSEFEGRLFRMMEALRSLISHMDVKNRSGQSFHAKDCFKGIMIDVITFVEKNSSGSPRDAPKIVNAYKETYDIHQDDLGPYFRILYHIFRFIDASEEKNEEKEEYADLVRAELSSGELCLLEINGLTDNGKKFKRLIERYNIIKHAPRNTRLDPNNVVVAQYNIERREG